MNDVRQGEVYWKDFGPAKGSAPAHRRPCVVVQCDAFNRTAIATTIVCVITSNQRLAAAPGNVSLRRGDANLSRASVVNVSQILTVDKSELTDRIGKLPEQVIDTVVAGLARVFERF